MNTQYLVVAVVLLWPLSCIACFVSGVIVYHAMRVLQARGGVYKPVVPYNLQQKLLEKRMKSLADKESAALQTGYINSIKGFTRDKFVDASGKTNEDSQFLEIPK